MRFFGFVFWMVVKIEYEIFVIIYRFYFDFGRNRLVVNGDLDKSWFIDNIGLSNC